MKNEMHKLMDKLRVEPGRPIDLLRDFDPGYTGNFMKKEDTEESPCTGNHRCCQNNRTSCMPRIPMPC